MFTGHLSATFFGLLLATTLATTAQAKTPVIFDTDMAIDDWSALLLLGNHPEIELLAVAANGAGETRCGPAMRNIPALLDLTEAGPVTVACGDDYPMDGFFAFPEPWRKQADTLSGVAIPNSERPVSKKHAVEVIHETLTEAKEPAVLLTTGSLTNIAQWLEKYPQDRNKISRLVIMGGSFDAPGNIIVPGFTDGHPNKWAEWNIYVDPIAADQVFASGLPIEVIGLDVTNLVKVTTEFAKNFKQRVATPASDFWDKVLDDNGWFIDSGEYYFWDVLAALVVINPEFCQGEMQPVYVTYETIDQPTKWTDQTIASTQVDGSKRNHLAPGKSGITKVGGERKPAKICRETDPALAFEVFTKTLNQTL